MPAASASQTKKLNEAPAPGETMRINLLGEPEVTVGAQRLALPQSKKTRALLAYLVVTGKTHRRERLCTLFWDIPDDPRGALRWSLSKLRGVVDEDGATRIVADRETVTFDAVGAEIDLLAVRDRLSGGIDALSVDELRELAGRFRGEFLEGLELDSCPDFQSWCMAEREDMRSRQIAVLETLVERLAGEADEALPHARALLEIDPYNEPARAGLVRLLGKAGRKREAEQQYKAGLHALAEAGVENPLELQAAWREANSKVATKPVTATAPCGPLAEPVQEAALQTFSYEPALAEIPFCGRTGELAKLYRILDSTVIQGHARVILLTGEPGIGKTRMLDEISAGIVVRGGSTVAGNCYEAESNRPFAPWIDALGALPLAGGGDDNSATTNERRERLFAAIAARVSQEAGLTTPIMLRLDDFHWSDEASAMLLHYLARRNRERPLMIMLAARDGELADNPAAGRVLRDLRRDGLLEEIELGPMAETELKALVSAMPDTADFDRLWHESGGNPLFAIELARFPSDSQNENVPLSLSRTVRDRLERLSATARDLLSWGAVAGDPFDIARIQGLISVGADELVDALEVLERHSLLRPASASGGASGGAYVFGNTLVRQAVYAGLSEPRRRLMHGRMMAALQALADTDGSVASEIARHAGLSGDDRAAAAACVSAARDCLKLFANAEAYGLAQRGRRHAERLDEPDRVERLIELTEIACAARRPENLEEAAHEILQLAERAQKMGCHDHARRGFHVASYLRWEQGQWLEARRETMRAEVASRAGNDGDRAIAMAEAARCLLVLERDLEQAEILLAEAGGLAASIGEEHPSIANGMGKLLHFHGALDEAEEEFVRSRALARATGDHMSEFNALEELTVLALERQHLEDARRYSTELLDIAGKLRGGSEAPFASALVALTTCALGEEDGQGSLEAAITELRFVDARHRLAWSLTRASMCELRRGLGDAARAHAEEALSINEQLGRASDIAITRVALARAAGIAGDKAGAERQLALLGEERIGEISFQAQQAMDDLLAEHAREAA
ncbi:MAG: AAA family ATPase [Proteobacteria bacterium]|nr:AAA family ATPase [Pseudomonadota bacterium]